MDDTVSSAELQSVLGVNSGMLATLARDGVVQRAKQRGRYLLTPSVQGYIKHLRDAAAGRGGEDAAKARARLGQAQATLAETKAKVLSGELVDASAVEAKWTSACRAIRATVLAVADRMRDLPPRQHVKLAQELRAALSDLANG
jgi:phage terminase Nu1 subunit (DNA packaging protein)